MAINTTLTMLLAKAVIIANWLQSTSPWPMLKKVTAEKYR